MEVKQAPSFDLHFLQVDTREIILEGIPKLPDNFIFIGARTGGKTHTFHQIQRSEAPAGAVRTSVPIHERTKLVFIAVDKNGTEVDLRIITHRYTNLAKFSFAYAKKANFLIVKHSKELRVVRYSKILHILYELRFLLRTAFNGNMSLVRKSISARKYKKVILAPIEALALVPRDIMIRLSYFLLSSTIPKNVWLISDRPMAAGDNGEALFRYIKKTDQNVATYFAISRQSPDYERLKKIGNVIDYGSFRYKLYFLSAKVIISSHADNETTNPFGRMLDRYVNLCDFQFVFLQHGVIRNDLSAWLNRYEKNIALFVTSAQKEYQSILDYPYYYKKQQLLKTGMPRYDELHGGTSGSQKTIIITPTYRNNLLTTPTNSQGQREYDPLFKKSNYAKFYNRLLKDAKLNEAMKKADIVGKFVVHPNFTAQQNDFTVGSQFEIAPYPYDYKRLLSDGSLLVTDYSSVAIDFAYLKKPIIYAHFDEGDFYTTHSFAKGDFFTDEDNGFGKVLYEYESIRNEIILKINQHFELEEKYLKRAETFFFHDDNSNAKRVYDAIIKSTT